PGRPRRVLLLHPDYSRNDFSHLVCPLLYEALSARGLERLDTLNASGTHRPMTDAELHAKLGLDPSRHSRVGSLHNHAFDAPPPHPRTISLPRGTPRRNWWRRSRAPCPTSRCA